MIDDLRRKLECSILEKSRQLKLKILLDNIAKNQYRIQSIFHRLKEGGYDKSFILKQVAKEELLSGELHDKLAALKELNDLTKIADIVKETKVGQGLLVT